MIGMKLKAIFETTDRWPGRLRPGQKMVGALLLAALASILFLGLVSGTSSATEKKEEFPVSTDSGNQKKPSVGGDVVVWEDDRDGVSAIYAKNLSTGEEFLVAKGTSVKRKPVTNGEFVVWEDDRGGGSDIYTRNIQHSTSTERLLAGGAGDQRKPEISGSIVVWESRNGSTGKWEIYSHDLTSQEPPSQQPLIVGGGIEANPAISGDTIVWQDDRDGVSAIYARNLATGEEFKVSESASFQDQPSISGSIVVWRQESVANYDIFGKDLYARDLESGEVFQITTDTKDQVAPSISGSVVIWEDYRNGKAEIFAKDLSTGREFPVAGAATSQTGLGATSPAISGETVVWETQYDGEPNYGNYDIQGANLDAPPAAPVGLKASGSLNGVFLKWRANGDGDLAGYNVYRSDLAGGTFTKLNQSLLSMLSFSDSDAPRGSISYYRVTAVDAAGNESLAGRAEAVAVAQSSVTLSAKPAVLKYGRAATLSGKLTADGKALSGKPVVLERRPAGAKRFSAVARRTTDSDGGFEFGGRKPTKHTVFRVRFPGEPGFRGSLANEVVKVRARVSLNKPKPEVKKNTRQIINGRVSTAKRGYVKVLVKHNGKIIYRKRVGLNNSTYRVSYRPTRVGRYTIQTVTSKTRTHLPSRIVRGFSAR